MFPFRSVAVLPQQIAPIPVVEPRYQQLVSSALDGAGQIALSTYAGSGEIDVVGDPPVRKAACIAQIVQHERQPDGHYILLLQGICRAGIIEETTEYEGNNYRTVMLEPLGLPFNDDEQLAEVRDALDLMLCEGPLSKMAAASWVLERVRNDAIPPSALLELASFTLLTDDSIRYRLLAEPDATARWGIVEYELHRLGRLIRMAERQGARDWPKGLSWN